MLSTHGKADHNTLRSYRPIASENVAENFLERVITHRLDWKLEAEDGVAVTQNSYRLQTSCVQSILRVAKTVSEAKAKMENTVLAVIH